MRKTCESCGADNPELASFCRQCGRPWGMPWVRSATRLTPVMQLWRRLKHRMTRKEVRALLGEPARVETTPPAAPAFEEWRYEYEPVAPTDLENEPSAANGTAKREQEAYGCAALRGTLRFDLSEGTLAAWTEPDWRC